MNEIGLDYQTLLSVYKDHTSVVNTLWGILQVVSLALLGFVYKEQYLRSSWLALLALSAIFSIFAFGNQAAMARSQKVLVAVVGQMSSEQALATVPKESGMKSVLEAHSVRSVERMRRGHSVLIVGVILLVWVPFVAGYLKDRRSVETKGGAP